LLNAIDYLYIKAETSPLSDSEKAVLRHVHERINILRRDEESKWTQVLRLSISKWVKITQNTFISMQMENIEKIQLEQDEGTFLGEDNLKVYITEYYKKLFGDLDHNSVSMMEDQVTDIPQLSPEENAILTAKFIEEEVFEAISSMEHKKYLRPDGFPVEFYQTFWDIIKVDLMAYLASYIQESCTL
jgi:hypothetical protein